MKLPFTNVDAFKHQRNTCFCPHPTYSYPPISSPTHTHDCIVMHNNNDTSGSYYEYAFSSHHKTDKLLLCVSNFTWGCFRFPLLKHVKHFSKDNCKALNYFAFIKHEVKTNGAKSVSKIDLISFFTQWAESILLDSKKKKMMIIYFEVTHKAWECLTSIQQFKVPH